MEPLVSAAGRHGRGATFDCGIVGSGTLPIQCAELLLARGHRVLFVLTADDALARWAQSKGIAAAHPKAGIESLAAGEPFDYLFSIVNEHILPEHVLRLPRRWAINYHDALLPRYAGTHATSWALLNGERVHGVTWHLITGLVDAGDVLKQREVAISETDTAASLNAQCYGAAIASFAELIDELATGTARPVPQDLSRRTFFPRFKRPHSAGVISWRNEAESIVRLVRAMDFGAYPNPMLQAKVLLAGQPLVVGSAELAESASDAPPGTVVETTPGGVRVAAQPVDVYLRELRTPTGERIPMDALVAKRDIRPGTRFDELDGESAALATSWHEAVSRHESFWLRALERLSPTPLPYSRTVPERAFPAIPRTDVPRSTVALELPAGLSSALGTTPVDLARALLVTYLARVNQCAAVDFGYVPANLPRGPAAIAALSSPVVPVSVAVDLDRGIHDLLGAFATACDAARAHGTYASDIWARYPSLRSLAAGGGRRTPFVAVADAGAADEDLAAAAAQLTLVADEAGSILLAYDPSHLEASQVCRIASHLGALAGSLVRDHRQPLHALSLLDQDEWDRVIRQWNQTSAPYPEDQTVVDLFDRQARQTPDAIAVSQGDEVLAYRELAARSDGLARLLRSRGVARGDLVGICVERTPAMVVALLGILKAGAGYVPLDPAFPQDRLSFMLEDSGARLLLTQTSLRELLPEARVPALCLDADAPVTEEGAPLPRTAPDNLAYVLYTSGSTGQPKGVEIQHRALTNFITSMMKAPGIAASDVMLALTTLSFDIAGLEIYLPLVAGARVEVVEREQAADARLLADRIRNCAATLIQATPATWRMLLDVGWEGSAGLKVLCGGEAMPPDLARKLLDRAAEVWNLYGPTETTIWSSVYRVTEAAEEIPIGQPIANTDMYVLDERLMPVPIGVPGELFIGGHGLARGYHNRPDLTADRFIAHPFSDRGVRLYRTGDIARYRDDGQLIHLGRKDFQVKVRGFRIELGEIESALLRHADVAQAVAVARTESSGASNLCAYVVPAPGGAGDADALRSFLRSTLPEFMVPQHVVFLDVLPLTPNGKVDRKRLPAPVKRSARPVARDDSSPEQERLRAIWEEVLGIQPIGMDENFFELGGNSLLVVRMLAEVEKAFRSRISIGQAFARPTIRALAELLSGNPVQQSRSAGSRGESALEGIAIVGMAGRFPGCNSVREYWEAICAGREMITFFDEEQIHPSIDRAVIRQPNYVKARGVLADAECFDSAFFGINPKEADVIDPQQRLLLEAAWHALEDAGLHARLIADDRVGVFAGVGDNEYYRRNLLGNPAVKEYGDFRLRLANEKDFSATRVAFALGLHGPAVNVQTACSTSLVAVSRGVQSLRAGECEIALCGGAHLPVPQASGHEFNEGSAHSRDGHCRPFDAEATGTVFSSAVGMVVLMPLGAALDRGLRVYAVIKGTGINNDGGGKMSFMAPSVEGQSRVLSQALADARVRADDVTYVEAHGTATPLGDPIEAEALGSVYGSPDRPTYLGSVKGNIGHGDAAAGIAGLIKTALAVHHRVIPPSINFTAPNPRIPLAQYGLEVVRELLPWPVDRPVCAAVSSLGVGGTNAHVILEAADTARPPAEMDDPALLLFSGKTPAAAEELENRVLAAIQAGTVTAGHAAATLAHHRQHFAYRRFSVLDRKEDAPTDLAGAARARQAEPDVAFLFPGQGCQYARMGETLYRRFDPFRRVIDECAEVLRPELGLDIRTLLYPGDESSAEASAARLEETRYTQPLLLSIGLALNSLWQAWGVKPKALVGHSIGEYAAACIAGVMTLPDALHLVAQRGRLMYQLPSGAMVSVRASHADVQPLLGPGSSIAAINGDNLCVASGPHDEIAALKEALSARAIQWSALHTSHAFHSPMMEPMLAAFESEVARVKLSPPAIPIVSTATAAWMTDDEATDPGYWARQIRLPVRFAEAMATLWSQGDHVALELGPRASATILARRAASDRKRHVAVPSLGDHPSREHGSMLAAAGNLWALGVRLQLDELFPGLPPASLPGYPFSRDRHWIEPAGPTAGSADLRALLEMQTRIMRNQAELLERTRNRLLERQQKLPTQ